MSEVDRLEMRTEKLEIVFRERRQKPIRGTRSGDHLSLPAKGEHDGAKAVPRSICTISGVCVKLANQRSVRASEHHGALRCQTGVSLRPQRECVSPRRPVRPIVPTLEEPQRGGNLMHVEWQTGAPRPAAMGRFDSRDLAADLQRRVVNVTREAVMSRILVVDDDPMVCMAIEIYLARHGFQVTVADGGESGLRALDGARFDLMVVDIFMPHMRGFESIRVFHRERVYPADSDVGCTFANVDSTAPDFLGWRSSLARRAVCASHLRRRS